MNSEKMKILLVEDDALNYLDIKNFLESEGYEVLSLPGKIMIDNYDDAIKVCEKDIPHLAILDIEIKGKKDGLDIAACIRENYYSPVIILSGKESNAYLSRARAIGVDGYTAKVDKPSDLRQLNITIQLLMPFAEKAARRRETSVFLHVKYAAEKNTGENMYIRKRIDWMELQLVTTEKAPKNNVLLQMADGLKLIYRSSLTDMALLLPDYFIQVNNYEMINANFFDGKGKTPWVYFIGSKKYEIANAYRTETAAAVLKRTCP
jgi:DNA-binding response OmpR family regulator